VAGPFTIKDSFDTEGVRTTRGSSLFAEHMPVADATAVAQLRAAGGIPLAKTNLPEMSYWTETDNLIVGRSLNPYNPERTPGGSKTIPADDLYRPNSQEEGNDRAMSSGASGGLY